MKIKIICSFLLLFFTIHCKAQKKADSIYLRGESFYKKGFYTEAQESFEKTILLYEKTNSVQLVSVYEYLGICLYLQSKYKEALDTYKIPIQSGLATTKQLGKLYLNMGLCYQKLANYDSSLIMAYRALPILSEYENRGRIMGDCYNLLGNSLRKLERNEEAIHNYKQAIEIFEDTVSIGYAYNNLALTFQNLSQLDSALFYYQKALICKQKTNSYNAPTISNIGIVHFKRGDYEKAIDFYKQAISIRRQKGKVRGLAISYNNLAKVSIVTNRLKEASVLLDSVAWLLSREEYPSIRQEYLLNKGKLHFALGELVRGEFFINRHNQLRDSIFSSEMSQRVADSEVKYKTEKILAESEKKDVLATLLTLQNEQKNYGILAVVSLLLISLVAIFYYFRANRAKQQVNEQISHYNEELKGLNEEINTQNHTLQLQKEKIEEQYGVIRFIKESLEHDLANDLLNLRDIALFPIHKLEETAYREKMEKLQNKLLAITNFYRLLIKNKEADGLQSKAFISELFDWLAEKYQRSDIALKLEVVLQESEEGQHGANGSKQQQRVLRDITTELFQNALKHAFPKSIVSPKIWLTVEQKNQQFLLSYRDNGIGLPSSVFKEGAQGMRLLKRISKDKALEFGNHAEGGTFIQLQF